MTADERLALVRIKIERAKKHLIDLEAACRVFLDSKPYKVAHKRDAQTRQVTYYLASVDSTPLPLSAIAGDAINNLRSALDHLAQQLYLVGTGASAYRDQTSFPIARSGKEFKAMFEGKEQRRKTFGMRDDAVDAIRALEPYDRGKGQDLWTLHRLNNIDKHRLVIAAGSSFRSLNLGAVVSKMARESFARSSLAANFLSSMPSSGLATTCARSRLATYSSQMLLMLKYTKMIISDSR
jgi:hypothetical protein